MASGMYSAGCAETQGRLATAHTAKHKPAIPSAAKCSSSVKKTAMITMTIRSSTTANVSRNALRDVGRLDPTTASTARANAMSVAAGIAHPWGCPSE